MARAEQIEGQVDEFQGVDFSGVERFTAAAYKRQRTWQNDPPAWERLPAIPPGKGSKERRTRRQEFWRGVVDQQLHADERAVEMATHLRDNSPAGPARDYYETMVTDESDHVGYWETLGEVGDLDLPASDRNPHLDSLCDMVLNPNYLATSAFLMQAIFEDRVRYRFDRIYRMAPGTLLGILCLGIRKDDTIHHKSGMVVVRSVFASNKPAVQAEVAKAAREALPLYVNHCFWRPRSRDKLARFTYEGDREQARIDIEAGKKTAASLGIDLSDIDYRIPDFPEVASSISIPNLPYKSD